jgi:hypothetical protein
MAPFSLSFDTHAGFIKAINMRCNQLLFDGLFDRLQNVVTGTIYVNQSALAQMMAKEINESLTQSI